LHQFGDPLRYWSKIAYFTYPTCIWRPIGGAPFEFLQDLWHQKTIYSYRVPVLLRGLVCLILSLISHFCTFTIRSIIWKHEVIDKTNW